jgi:predicted transcriptional regulator
MLRPTAEARIIEALGTYEWEPTACVYQFASSLGYSESYVRNILANLIAEGVVLRVQDGEHRGKPRYIYRLTQEELCQQKSHAS